MSAKNRRRKAPPLMQVKVIDMLKEGMLLPPPADTCQECAVKHEPQMPHNQQSLFYQYSFRKKNDRWPTWADAMAHCAPEMRAQWTSMLAERGVTV